MCYGIMYDSGSGMTIVGPEDVKQQEKIILKSQKKAFLLSYYMVY